MFKYYIRFGDVFLSMPVINYAWRVLAGHVFYCKWGELSTSRKC